MDDARALEAEHGRSTDPLTEKAGKEQVFAFAAPE
jgi:hypothetical protein